MKGEDIGFKVNWQARRFTQNQKIAGSNFVHYREPVKKRR
jgi:hypothetical protein